MKTKNKFQYKHNFPECFFLKKRIRIGLLGGSFNPSHFGHIHISNVAMKRLNLNEIWWLVSPQNRLKDLNIRSSFEKRVQFARELTKSFKKIKVLDIENKNRLFSSIISLKFIKKRTKNAKFIWLMGSDNLIDFQYWLQADKISKIFPVAVIERPRYSYKAINSIGAYVLDKRLLKTKKSKVNLKTGSWTFIRDVLNNLSSSKIRNKHTSFINETFK